ncbi:hypothetical protein HK101_000781 [Irineochytrium annulatum]|nr:hypothetical protein HK101_000781 [Irineochytrium annulatum]
MARFHVQKADWITIWLGNDTEASNISLTSVTVTDDGHVNVFWNTTTDVAYDICLESKPGMCVASVGCNRADKLNGYGAHLPVGVYYWYADLFGQAKGILCMMGHEGVVTVVGSSSLGAPSLSSTAGLPTTATAQSVTLSSATATTAAEQPHVGSSSNPSTGAIAGGVVGVVVALGVVAAVAVWSRRKRRRTAAKGAATVAAMDAANVDSRPVRRVGWLG